MVILQKSRTVGGRTRSTGLKAKLRSSFGVMPIRALRFGFNYALPTLALCATGRKAEFSRVSTKAWESVKPIYAITGGHDGERQFDPMDIYRSMRSAAVTYTALFYAMTAEELTRYLSICNERGILNRRPTEQNIMIYPALMALQGKPKIEVKNSMIMGLYRKPFALMHDFSRDAIRIDMFRQSVSIKSIGDDTLDYVRDQIAAMGTRISAIERFDIRPVDDDEFRRSFLDRAVDLTMNGEVCLAHYMEERMDPSKSYSRIIRL